VVPNIQIEHPELHTIKTRPVARHRVDMHEKDLREWFEKGYWPELEYTGVKSEKYVEGVPDSLPCGRRSSGSTVIESISARLPRA
jgi:hypothetical protein